MFGKVLPALYELPTAPVPRAATSRTLRTNPVIRLVRLATAIVRLFASMPRVPSSAAGSAAAGSAVAAAVVGGAAVAAAALRASSIVSAAGFVPGRSRRLPT